MIDTGAWVFVRMVSLLENTDQQRFIDLTAVSSGQIVGYLSD